MKVRVFSPNLARLVFDITALAEVLPEEMGANIKQLAEQVLEDSRTVPPFVPQSAGALLATGRVEQAREATGTFAKGYAVVYGGGGVDYAEYVHDQMGWWDKPLAEINFTEPGSGPKFVSTHIERRAGEVNATIGIALNRLVSRMVK